MPRFLFIGSSVDGNEHGLHVLLLQFIFIRQTALVLSELGVKRGLGCKVQRERGKKRQVVPNVIPGTTGYWPLCQDRLSMLLEEREMSIDSFLNDVAFKESCFWPIACGPVHGMGIYGLQGRIGFVGMGPILGAFLPGSESCVKIEDYSRKACLVLEKRKGIRCLFLKWFEVLSAC